GRGAERPVVLSAAPTRDAPGRVPGAVVVARDVTERRRHEAELARSEGRARRLSDSDVVGVLYWTGDGRVAWANDEFLRLSGYSRADLAAGRLRWDRLTPPAWAARDAQMWAELRRRRRGRPLGRELGPARGRPGAGVRGGAPVRGAHRAGPALALPHPPP